MKKRQVDEMKIPKKSKRPICKCNTECDELGSYFGIPMHRHNADWRVCRLWSGLPRSV